ncbi:MAG: 16S rRNA (cytosine(1402)-N(4))-methyltransferase RsmH [Clostridiales bacterium]|nr:16S rRNA (cytosine(1402)-N(4))-methyltransferase RsmH [Clostridiales bacterium]
MMYHVPIMASEIVEALNVEKGKLFLDATLGGGGHTSAILKAGGSVVAIDRDDEALQYCQSYITGDITYIKGQYENAPALLRERGIEHISGAVIDCGVSSHQLDEPERGFSYMHDGALDMRMDRAQKFSAYDVVNGYTEEQLIDILRRYGEENFARRIASAIVKRRAQGDIKRTVELAELIRQSVPYRKSGHPAKKTFQAIRIEVNGELKGLYDAICGIFDMIESGGRLAVLSFHSLEDRIVKAVFKEFQTDCICPKQLPVCVCNHRAIGKTVAKLKPSEREQQENTRSTCATLRITEKL